ncbi:integrase [Clostridium botulinum]|nr:integrase [Clostridium botulinum]
MVRNVIMQIEEKMSGVLNNEQMRYLSKAMEKVFIGLTISKDENKTYISSDKVYNYVEMFICAKQVEGCSEKSIKYYKSTINNMLKIIKKPVKQIITEDIRSYLAYYYKNSRCSKVSIDNIRRIISSFFSWLEEEDYILKSPVRRIHKIKTTKVVKETYSDENLEIMRDNCSSIRDLAIIDLLNSTGMRVGELVGLNINDIDFNERECIVLGKGDKQRKVYFDAKTKIHLKKYIESRNDNNEALFVSLQNPYKRLQISGVEIRMRQLGHKLNINKVHPHKFRRTLATRAIDKGMPIEQVQQLLGHQKIDTTLQYAMVNQSNVKIAHRKFIS